MMTWLFLATLVYVAANAIIGFARLRGDTFESFVGYRNKVSWWPLVLSINGTFIGGGMFFATGELAYKAGLVPIVLALATAIGLGGLSMLVSRIRNFADNTKAITLYDIIERRFASGARPFLAAVATVNIVLYFFLLAGQFLALSTFLEALGGVQHHTALAIAIGVVFINTMVYSVVGGLKKDIWTDVFQMLVVGIAAVVLALAILGPAHRTALHSLPPPVAPEQFGTLFIAGVLLFFTPAFLVRYDLWQRVLAAKDTRTARKAVLLSIPIVVAAYVLFTLCGNYGRLFATEAAGGRFAVISTMQHVLGKPGYIAVVLGLYAAVMSSADTFLNITSISLHRLVTGGPGNQDGPQALLQIRVFTVVVCFAAGALVLLAPSIIELMVGAFSSLVITVPAVLYALLARRPNPKPATASIVAGLFVFLGMFLALPSFRSIAFTLATVVALIALLIGLLAVGRTTAIVPPQDQQATPQ